MNDQRIRVDCLDAGAQAVLLVRPAPWHGQKASRLVGYDKRRVGMSDRDHRVRKSALVRRRFSQSGVGNGRQAVRLIEMGDGVETRQAQAVTGDIVVTEACVTHQQAGFDRRRVRCP